jgi:hypothetical protein
VNLGEVVQNSFNGNTVYGECLAAPGQLWWGNTSFSSAAAGQTVFTQDVGTGYTVLDVPALTNICAFTMIYPEKGQMWYDLEVDDETGNWYAYVLNGAGQVSCAAIPNLQSRAGFIASGSPGSTGPALALDGKLSTRWTTNGAQVPGQFIQVDMGVAKPISSITMDSAGDTLDYARGYQVFLSNDGQSWGTNVTSGAGSAPLITASFPRTTARYIKVVQTSNKATSKWWSVHELNVYY